MPKIAQAKIWPLKTLGVKENHITYTDINYQHIDKLHFLNYMYKS
jgi:hypothetical protein